MMLSDARTRGPWHKIWIRYIRATDITDMLFQAMQKSSTAEFDQISSARDLARAEELKILAEVRRALTAGGGESDQESDRLVPVDPKERYRRFLLKLEPESNQPDPSSGD